MNKINKSILCFAISFLLAISVHAETFRVLESSPKGNDGAGKLITLDASYDNETELLRFFGTFKQGFSGQLPNGFGLVLNGTGANPKGHDGELAIFFFDASDAANPKMTVYAYNGKNNGIETGASSHIDGSGAGGRQPADKILTSLNPITVDTYDIKLVYTPSADGETVRMGFILNSELIQEHIPAYFGNINDGEVWQGAQFEKKVGYWFQPRSGLTVEYAADGYIVADPSAVTIERAGFYDFFDVPAVSESPECTVLGESIVTTEIGQKVSLQFAAQDPQNETLKFAVTGLPVKAMIEGSNDASNVVNVMFVPSNEEEGEMYMVKVTYTDRVQATTSCSIKVNVNPNAEPVATIFNAGAFNTVSCAEETATVTLDGSASSDKNEAPSELTAKWTTDCPNAQIADDMAFVTTLTFETIVDNKATGCTATLTVSDGQKSDEATTEISVTDCPFDCEGVAFGTAVVDKCGICNGGDADLDRCGVCNGDGDSCLDCETTTQNVTINELDASLFAMSRDVVRIARSIKQNNRRGRLGKRLQSRVDDAQESYEAGWVAVNNVPVQAVACANTQFCVSVSSAASEEAFLNESAEIVADAKFIARKARKKLRRKGVSRSNIRRLVTRPLKRIKFEAAQNQLIAAQLKTSTDICQ